MPVELEERAREFVKEQKGKISVDWKALARLEGTRVYGGSTPTRIIDNIFEFLKEREILVYDNTPRSYFATGFGVPLHPKLSEIDVKYSFADKQNAREYYSHFFKDALYGVILHQTIGAIQKAK